MAELDKTGDPSGVMDKDDVITFLGDDSDEKEIISLEEDKDRKEPIKKEARKSEPKEPDEVDDELKEVENELEKPDESKLELLTPVSRTAILKKYPNLFKDFPELENTHHREQAFSERFPTIKDADNALMDSETVKGLEGDLAEGKTEKILLAAKTNPDAFNRLVDDYLTVLGRVDEKAYHHVVGNTIKYTIVSMLQEAKSSSDDKLQEAAQILNYFVFGSSKFEPPTNLAKPKTETSDETKLTSERKERFQAVSDELLTRINKSIKNTVDVNIDPQNQMREYDKRNATRDVLEKLEFLIDNDTRFKIVMDKLWKDAANSNYSKASVDKIKSTFFSKAKNLLPDIIKKARGEATSGKKSEPQKEVKKDKSDRPDKPSNESRSSHSNNKKQEILKGMSTLDFLNAED